MILWSQFPYLQKRELLEQRFPVLAALTIHWELSADLGADSWGVTSKVRAWEPQPGEQPGGVGRPAGRSHWKSDPGLTSRDTGLWVCGQVYFERSL